MADRITIVALLNPAREEETPKAVVARAMVAVKPSTSPSTAPSQPFSDGTDVSSETSSPSELEYLEEKRERCQRCLCLFPKRFISDHYRTHVLEVSEGVRVPRDHSCAKCLAKGRKCLVARRPKNKRLRTFRCLECLKGNEKCSFVASYCHLDPRDTECHPAM